MKKTLVIGASTNPERYAYKAVKLLKQKGFEVVALGQKAGEIDGVFIRTEKVFEPFHTVSIYVNSEIQKSYYAYILELKPARVIFNPGTENEAFKKQLTAAGVFSEEACTLVLLNTGQY